jgi:hypothetical protein
VSKKEKLTIASKKKEKIVPKEKLTIFLEKQIIKTFSFTIL